jgi:hypothetical protein
MPGRTVCCSNACYFGKSRLPSSNPEKKDVTVLTKLDSDGDVYRITNPETKHSILFPRRKDLEIEVCVLSLCCEVVCVLCLFCFIQAPDLGADCLRSGRTQVDSDIKKLWKDCGAKSKETPETVRKALEAHGLVSPRNLEP